MADAFVRVPLSDAPIYAVIDAQRDQVSSNRDHARAHFFEHVLDVRTAHTLAELALSPSHGIDRRERMGDLGPCVALVLADPEPARRRAHREPVAGGVER